ncbi:hypothetical protein PPYR_12902 [Photinus pyralis]|uniref:G-protein coupled receptors family 1 profile domain-containing protein n=1 Tax=Photinus pyralis TaxID=7054 RepID=A0A5N4A7J5_PHOPY|nr:hypothetical protein PPYR_12902 [Photinus pyralis]
MNYNSTSYEFEIPECNNNRAFQDDLSTVAFINDIWLVAPTEEIIIKVSIMIPVVSWGIFGNVSLMYIIIKNAYLQSPTNVLIANMALADFILLAVHPSFFLGHDFFQNYPFGEFGCRFEGAFECGVLAASVTNLVAISYDRLNSIAQPQEKRLTINKAKIIMVVVWIIGLLFTIPPVVLRSYRERQWLDFLEKYCTEDVILVNVYWHIFIIVIVWVPLGTMLVCYVALFIKLRQYEKIVLRKMKAVTVQYKKQVAKMMFVVVIAFIICRFPFTALIIYRNERLKRNRSMKSESVINQVNGSYYTLWFVSKYLILINAAINPIIYGLTSERFRKEFQKIPVIKYMFPERHKQIPHHEIKSKRKRITTTTTNRINIFLIFKKHKNKPLHINETVTTNSDSQAPIIVN